MVKPKVLSNCLALQSPNQNSVCCNTRRRDHVLFSCSAAQQQQQQHQQPQPPLQLKHNNTLHPRRWPPRRSFIFKLVTIWKNYRNRRSSPSVRLHSMSGTVCIGEPGYSGCAGWLSCNHGLAGLYKLLRELGFVPQRVLFVFIEMVN